MAGPEKKAERRHRAAPAGPAKGHDETAPGRRPFRGVAGTASVVTPRAAGPRLAGLLEAVTHAHAWSGLSPRPSSGRGQMPGSVSVASGATAGRTSRPAPLPLYTA